MKCYIFVDGNGCNVGPRSSNISRRVFFIKNVLTFEPFANSLELLLANIDTTWNSQQIHYLKMLKLFTLRGDFYQITQIFAGVNETFLILKELKQLSSTAKRSAERKPTIKHSCRK